MINSRLVFLKVFGRIFKNTSINLQFLKINENSLAVLTNSSIVLYNITSYPLKISQKLSAVKPKQMILETFKNHTFLAVLNNAQENSLNKGFVEIYR